MVVERERMNSSGTTSQTKRLLFLGACLGVCFAALAYRLVDLQVLRHEQLTSTARKNTHRTFMREPRRGDIRDVRGNLLATSVFVKTVCADPSLLGEYYSEVARVLAPILNLNEGELARRLQPQVRLDANGRVTTNRYVVLAHKVRAETWQVAQEKLAKLAFGVDEQKLTKAQRTFFRDLRTKAVFADSVEDQLRVYPGNSIAAHVLGFVGRDDHLGKEGIEASLNSKLTGAHGWRMTETDARKRELVNLRAQDVAPRDGLNVVLTIDAGVQHIAESELAEAMKKHTPISGSVVVMRPKTGEILAMVTFPNFDPNAPGNYPAEHRRNRVVNDMSEPGSTFKVVVVSGALNDKIVSLRETFDCERGNFSFAGKVLRDHDPYGILSVESIITKSSNIGSAKIGIKLGEEPLYNYIRSFGFGERTGIILPGEAGGIVHPLKRWSKLSISRIPMGHEVAATPLQMVMMMGAIANGGKLMRPSLVDHLEDSSGRVVAKFAPQVIREVVRPEAAAQMIQALKTVIGPDGTAVKAKLEFFSVAGKTGTAQKAGPGGYLPGKYFSSFIGFFPANDAELCISVLLDEPHNGYYGGQTAAPVFARIAERAANYLGLKPDLVPSETFVSNKKPLVSNRPTRN